MSILPGSPTQQLTLYGRSACHLCEDMEQALRPYCAELGLTLRVVEIDGDADLRARYADKIPVLMAGDTEICHYYLDPEALRAHFGHSADSV